MTTPEGTRPRRRIGRIIGFTALALVAVLVLVAVGLWVFKPWAPDVVVADPGEGGSRVEVDAAPANFYPAAGDGGRSPAVLVLGGSEGGINPLVDRQAQLLAASGFNALALSYFGAPGQESAMAGLPLELFDAALAWLGEQPSVDPERLGVLGSSKGAEAALLVASEHPELSAVVAFAPSSVSWQGLDLVEPWRTPSIGSTWSRGGADVPYLPYPEGQPSGDLVAMYAEGLTTVDQHPDAVIPVDRITAPILLVCGAQDTLWPSCDMAAAVQQRVVDAGGTATLVQYDEAGHFAGGAPVLADEAAFEGLGAYGGTSQANADARADSWDRTIQLLGAAFRA